jgi:hypothetical protein
MKLSLFALLFTSVAMARPEIILAPVDHLYVPIGFDSNDSVEVVVSGSFPNACYSRNKFEVQVTDDVIDVQVTAIAPGNGVDKAARICPQMIVPFKEVVAVGNLQGGDYVIRVNGKLQENLTVAEASSNSVDDSVYAAIDYVEKKGKDEFVLHGWRYSECVQLDKIKVLSNKKDTFSILPIMKASSDDCPMKGMPVAYPVKLDFSEVKIKKPLLHVRTMDGKSVNSIVTIEE